jgi:hypothetical protein
VRLCFIPPAWAAFKLSVWSHYERVAKAAAIEWVEQRLHVALTSPLALRRLSNEVDDEGELVTLKDIGYWYIEELNTDLASVDLLDGSVVEVGLPYGQRVFFDVTTKTQATPEYVKEKTEGLLARARQFPDEQVFVVVCLDEDVENARESPLPQVAFDTAKASGLGRIVAGVQSKTRAIHLARSLGAYAKGQEPYRDIFQAPLNGGRNGDDQEA